MRLASRKRIYPHLLIRYKIFLNIMNSIFTASSYHVEIPNSPVSRPAKRLTMYDDILFPISVEMRQVWFGWGRRGLHVCMMEWI